MAKNPKFTDQDLNNFKEMRDISAILTARSAEVADNIGKQGKNMGNVLSASIKEAEQGKISLDILKSRSSLIQEIATGEMSLEQISSKRKDIEDEMTKISRRYWGLNKVIGDEKQRQLQLELEMLDGEEGRLEASERSNQLMAGIDDLTGGLATKAKDFGEALKSPIVGTFAILGLIIGLMTAVGAQTDMIGDKFGAIGVTDFRSDLVGATAEATRLGYGFDEVAGSVSELSNNFGIAFGEAIKISEASMDTARAIGISTDQAAGLTGQLMTIAGHSAESAQNFLKQTAALAKSAGVAPGAIMEDIAGSSEEIASYSKDSGENIAMAAVKARSMGLALSDVAKIADGLLDFGSSLEAEMTASVMIGRQLNLQKARELALAGDLAGLQDEILTQVGSEAEFNEMNVLQRRALANAIGVGVGEMSKMVKESGKSTQELARMRELDLSQIASPEAIGNITLFMNNLKSVGVTILGALSSVTNFFDSFGEGWSTVGTVLTLLGIAILGIGLYLGMTALSAYATGAGLTAAGAGATAAGGGLASMAVAGTAAIPILLTIAAVAAALGIAFFGIGYILKQMPPVIDAMSKGFKIIATTITDSILKLATPEVVLGIMGLAGAFWMLAGALIAVAYAGVMAIPAMVAVTGFTAAMTALSAIGGGEEAEQQNQTEALKIELQTLNTAMRELIESFNKKWIPAVVMSNVEGGKRSGKEVMKSLSNAQFS